MGSGLKSLPEYGPLKALIARVGVSSADPSLMLDLDQAKGASLPWMALQMTPLRLQVETASRFETS